MARKSPKKLRAKTAKMKKKVAKKSSRKGMTHKMKKKTVVATKPAIVKTTTVPAPTEEMAGTAPETM